MNDGSFCSLYEIQEAPSDGHCLLHAIVSSANSQLSDCVYYDIGYLIDVVRRETHTNINEYVQFYEENPHAALLRDMDRYLNYKIYNTRYGDIVPMILANALQLNLVLINDLTVVQKLQLVECRVPHYGKFVALQKCPDHYNGIVKKVAIRGLENTNHNIKHDLVNPVEHCHPCERPNLSCTCSSVGGGNKLPDGHSGNTPSSDRKRHASLPFSYSEKYGKCETIKSATQLKICSWNINGLSQFK